MINQNLLKKHKITSIILIIFSLNSYSQNLVPNGNFESFLSCPNDFGQIDLASYWFTPSTHVYTSDYYNQCANSSVSVPDNWGGFQQAHSGIAYAGITLIEGTDFREYIEVQLDSTLTKSCYHFEMYVNLANTCRSTTNSIGVYFSDTAITGINNSLPLPFIPQINNNAGFITDTANWTLISGDYNASGSENFMIIGNFNDDANSSFLTVNPAGQNITYFYIDDVSLARCNVGFIEINKKENKISIYPNPASGFITLQSEQLINGNIYIINNLGLVVKEQEIKQENEKTIDIHSLPAGLYLLRYKEQTLRFMVIK